MHTDLSMDMGSTSAILAPARILSLIRVEDATSSGFIFIGNIVLLALAMLLAFLFWKCSSSSLDPASDDDVLDVTWKADLFLQREIKLHVAQIKLQVNSMDSGRFENFFVLRAWYHYKRHVCKISNLYH